MRDFNAVVEELNSFPSPEDIRQHLRRKGVRGYPGVAHGCPISEYVRAEVEDRTHDILTSFSYHGYAWNEEGRPCVQVLGTGRSSSLSEVAGEFIKAFDNEEYPELIKEGYSDA